MAQSKAKLYERLRTVQPLPQQHLFLEQNTNNSRIARAFLGRDRHDDDHSVKIFALSPCF
jgi:hypothetical protein